MQCERTRIELKDATNGSVQEPIVRPFSIPEGLCYWKQRCLHWPPRLARSMIGMHEPIGSCVTTNGAAHNLRRHNQAQPS
eukprot:2396002-Pyramimonas_sp.AAC.1